MSADGNTIVFGESEFDDTGKHGSMGIGVGVKKEARTITLSDLILALKATDVI